MVLRSSGIGAMVVTVAVVGMMVPHVHSFTTPSALPGAHTHGRHSLLSTMRSSRSVAVQRSLHSVHMSVALDNFESGGADPVDSIQSLDSLVSRKEVTKLIKQTSDLEGAKQTLFNLLCYGVCAAAGATSASLIGPASIAMAFVLSFNFMCLHETVHRSAFKSRKLNDLTMHAAGFSTLRPAQHYFYYHWGHHKFTGNEEKDSELQPSALDMDTSTLAGYLMYLSGLPFWFDAVTTTVKHSVGICEEKYLESPKAKQEVTNEARIYLAIYAALIGASVLSPALGAALLKFWVIPSVLGQPFLRFYLFAEHRGCPNDSNIVMNTRTMKTNWFYRKLAWNMPYHLEHHAWPYVPFHKLQDAHNLIRQSGGDSVITGPCNPEGDIGYFKLNWHFVKSLLGKKDEATFPSGSA